VSDDLEFDAQTDKGMVRSENQGRTGHWIDVKEEVAREQGRLGASRARRPSRPSSRASANRRIAA
jgi:hypothetical protein